MIKLVVSDIDGTLLHGEETEIAPEVFAQIERLRAKGILFCPASGRQYQSLRRLFAPIADEIAYICENGSVVFGVGNPGTVLTKVALPLASVLTLTQEALEIDGVELVISGENVSYLCPKDLDLGDGLQKYLGNRVAHVPTVADVPEDIVKISLYSQHGMTPALYELQGRWEAAFDVAVSGSMWMDFTLSDKSKGLQALCAAFGIAQSEVLAVGDNYNDVAMLQWVGHPYLMENAAPALRAQLIEQCKMATPNRTLRHCKTVQELLASIEA